MPRILALSPGGRHFAIATLDGDVLVRAEVHSLRRFRDPAEKFRAFLDALRVAVEQDAPAIIAVEALDARRTTPMANGQALRALAEATARGIHGITAVPSRPDPALADRFPDLRTALDALACQHDPRRSRRLLAAVAVALATADAHAEART